MSARTESPAAATPAAPLQTANRPLLIVAVMAAMVMQILDTTIANVALPHMRASLSATQETITWVLTSYVLASAVALPLGGWLVSNFGLRRVFVICVIGFTAASVLCGLSQSLTQMVLFRVAQGLFGAFLGPFAQTVMLDVSTPEERPKMMSLFSQGIMLGPIAGPVLGGWITENSDWRWVFFINVPVGIFAALVLVALLPRTQVRPQRMDILGWLFVALALSAFQLMLDRGETKDWFGSGEIVTYAVIAAVGAWLTVVHLSTTPRPIYARRIFSDPNFVVSMGLQFLMGSILISVSALMPGLLQNLYGYPVIDAGLLLAPRGIGMLASMMVFGKLMGRMDPRLALGIGLVVTGWSLHMMAGWSPNMPTGPIIVSGVIQGIGMSFTYMPVNLIAFSTLPGQYRTDAAGLLNLCRSIGSSIGIAVVTVLLSQGIQRNHAELTERITRMSVPADLDRITAYGGAAESVARVVDGMVNQQAAMIAYLNDFFLMALVCWATIPVLALVKVNRNASGPMPQMAADH
ncbi:DHA2 family efflux MFS transporter permease subunit [Novosphingobium olei]|uniref:DHA2 family efflux MFS transporter permease subunit n=1 Tax=Novosphingobium olei TaxID=2728851 RepID=UPI0030870C47|nr:DHA2 family efflux MFS transporter permease subunit [Novosphingobium olei]